MTNVAIIRIVAGVLAAIVFAILLYRTAQKKSPR